MAGARWCDGHILTDAKLLNRVRKQRLGKARKLLLAHTRVREKHSNILFCNEVNGSYRFFRLRPVWCLSKPAQIEVAHQINLHGKREELKHRKDKVWLNREVAVRRLQEVPLTDSPHLIRHATHIVDSAYVLDHRIRIRNIELLITELTDPWRLPEAG
jgi:hypothetical protein